MCSLCPLSLCIVYPLVSPLGVFSVPFVLMYCVPACVTIGCVLCALCPYVLCTRLCHHWVCLCALCPYVLCTRLCHHWVCLCALCPYVLCTRLCHHCQSVYSKSEQCPFYTHSPVCAVSVCEQEPVCLSASVCASAPHSCIVCLMTHLAGQIHAGLKGVLAMSCSKNRIE